MKRCFHSTCFYSALSALLFCCCASAHANDDLALVGVTASRALISVNNGKPHWYAVGDTQAGVTVRAIDGERVTLDFNGQHQTLSLGDNDKISGKTPASGAQQVILHAGQGGHFFADGTINGVSTRFVVDTGATLIAMNSAEAQRLGINYTKGERAFANTAGGVVAAYRVKLDTVSIGGVTLNNVDAAVQDNNALPVILLGMSFLNRMEMQRDGDTMTLKKRY